MSTGGIMTTTRGITAGQARNTRWGFLSGIDIGADGDPYLDRFRLIETPWLAVFLHHIHRPDADPHPHDHPWPRFWSLVLCGGYEEKVWPDKRNPYRVILRKRPRWSLGHLSRKSAHIITKIQAPLWTLVLTTSSEGTDSWGFWVPVSGMTAKFVPWREYISANGAAEYAAAKDAEDGPGQPVIRDLRRPGPRLSGEQKRRLRDISGRIRDGGL